MFAALNDAGVKHDDDQLVVITLLARGDFRDMPEHRNGITDDELRQVVGTLGDWKKSGHLAEGISTILREYAEATGVASGESADDAVTEDQLGDLARIQSEEKYDDESWFAFIESAVGVTVTANKDLTEAQATQLIDLFDNAEARPE